MTTKPSQMNHNHLGLYGEELASDALAGVGYKILEHNWDAPAGQIDLIAYHRHKLVAIEVKTRSGTGFGDPLAALSAQQLRRIHRGLLNFKQTVYPKYAHTPTRVDMVGILVDPNGDTTVELLQDVI